MLKWKDKNGIYENILKNSESNSQLQLKKEKPYVYKKMLKFPDKVKNGESIAIIQFQYDYVCNFKCKHCSISKFQLTPQQQKKDEREFFTSVKVKDLANQADEMGLAHFVISGGEPLIFSDFDEIVEAIDPQKFYITSDTNGWLLNLEKAKHLKSIGIDKLQISLDSLNEESHDNFRNKKGSWKKCINGILAAKSIGLNVIVQTVAWKNRIKSKEFETFIRFFNIYDVPVFVSLAKPVGNWENNFDILVEKDELKYLNEMQKKYNVFTHLTPSYEFDLGCIAIKKMISITKYGDVMPCPFMQMSIGNIFNESLKIIIKRGMNIKYFGEYHNVCWVAMNKKFIKKYLTKTYDKQLPVYYSEVFEKRDYNDNSNWS